MVQIKVVKILKELAKSEPKESPSQTLNGKLDKHILTNNKITDDKPSKQLFSRQVTTHLPLVN